MGKKVVVGILAFFVIGSFVKSFAQGRSASQVTLETPYNTVYSHLYYLEPENYRPDLAAKTIAPVVDSIQAIELAIQLKQILDGKGLFVHLNKIPNTANYFDSLSRQEIYTLFPKKLPDVYLEKTDGKWYYSKETIQKIPGLHKRVYPFGANILVNIFHKFGNQKLFGIMIWQYVGLLIFLVLFLILYGILTWLIRPVIRKISDRYVTSTLVEPKIIWGISKIIVLLFLLQISLILFPVLQLPVEIFRFSVLTIKIISVVLFVMLLLRIWKIVTIYAKNYAIGTTSKMDEQLIPILNRGIQIVIITGGVIQALRIMEVNVTALIAGVSIGGLAIALAAQDAVKNLIGSVMIFFDTPFQIGDWVEWGGFEGTVVEVGFRSTRIQTTDSSIISVPNGTISSIAITNRGVRVFRLFNIKIGVTYDTPPELLEQFIKGLKAIVQKHPAAADGNFHIHLNEMADSSLNILFRVPIQTTTYAGELKIKEELLFAILRLARLLGIQFAFPSTSVYVETFPEKASNLPDYDLKKKEMDDTLKQFLAGLKFEDKS